MSQVAGFANGLAAEHQIRSDYRRGVVNQTEPVVEGNFTQERADRTGGAIYGFRTVMTARAGDLGTYQAFRGEFPTAAAGATASLIAATGSWTAIIDGSGLASGAFDVVVGDALADAYTIRQAANPYFTIRTSNLTEAVFLEPNGAAGDIAATDHSGLRIGSDPVSTYVSTGDLSGHSLTIRTMQGGPSVAQPNAGGSLGFFLGNGGASATPGIAGGAGGGYGTGAGVGGDSTSTGNAGAGGSYNATSGAGGSKTGAGATGAGGDGGAFSLNIGAGGNSSSTGGAVNAGRGGDLFVMLGAGGTQSGVAGGAGGRGSDYLVSGNLGGAFTGGGAGGAGGRGGNYTVTLGAGGATNATGASAGGAGGGYNLTAGAGGAQSAGSGPGGAGGGYAVTTGAGGAYTGGGAVGLGGNAGGYTVATGAGGATNSTGGAAQIGGTGGDYTVTLGAGGAQTGVAGNAGGRGGDYGLTAGTGGASAAAGGGRGGNVTVGAGNAGASAGGFGANGGNVTLAPGTPTGTGTPGALFVGGANPRPLIENVFRTAYGDANQAATAAEIRGGLMSMTPTAARTITIVGATIESVATGWANGHALPLRITNLAVGGAPTNTITLTAGAGVTLIGSGQVNDIVGSQGASWLLVRTALNTFDAVRVG